MSGQKRCSKCDTIKDVADFSKNRLKKDGLGSECKVCSSARVKKWATDNPDRVAAYREAYYAATKDKQRERAKEWHHANKDRSRTSHADWRARNKDAIKAKKRFDATGFTESVFNTAVTVQRGLCGICARKLSDLPPRHTHADHDHATGTPRGVLCHHCNVALGYFGDNVATLRAAIRYLQHPPLELA